MKKVFLTLGPDDCQKSHDFKNGGLNQFSDSLRTGV